MQTDDFLPPQYGWNGKNPLDIKKKCRFQLVIYESTNYHQFSRHGRKLTFFPQFSTKIRREPRITANALHLKLHEWVWIHTYAHHIHSPVLWTKRFRTCSLSDVVFRADNSTAAATKNYLWHWCVISMTVTPESKLKLLQNWHFVCKFIAQRNNHANGIYVNLLALSVTNKLNIVDSSYECNEQCTMDTQRCRQPVPSGTEKFVRWYPTDSPPWIAATLITLRLISFAFCSCTTQNRSNACCLF